MNEHIKHLEEPLYYGQCGKVLDLFDEIINAEYVSIKVDGSPSIIFGKDEDDIFFVATKSIFSRNRSRYTTISQIQNLQDSELAAKLETCYYNLWPIFKHTNLIYQGDLISWVGNNESVHQPNVLQYRFNNTGDLSLSVHTAYRDLNFNEIPYDDELDHRSNFKNKIPLTTAVKKELRNVYYKWYKTTREYCVELPLNYSNHLAGLSTKKLPIERYFNNAVRTNIEVNPTTFRYWFNEKHTNILNMYKLEAYRKLYLHFMEECDKIIMSKWFDDYLKLYCSTVMFKNQLIDILNNYVYSIKNDYHRHVASFEVLNGEHEGFVFTTKNGKVKLVNRDKFSKMNFDKHG